MNSSLQFAHLELLAFAGVPSVHTVPLATKMCIAGKGGDKRRQEEEKVSRASDEGR